MADSDAPYVAVSDSEIARAWSSDLGERHDPSGEAVARLLNAYRGPGRYYHTIEHAIEVARTARQLSLELSDTHADDVSLAAWCHDACYVRGATANEARSATFGETLALDLGFGHDRARAVHGMITASSHTITPASRLEAIVCDADLAVLGKPWQAYCDDVENIRVELGIERGEAWRRKRLAMLAFFDRKRPLYHLDEARRRWYHHAVVNRSHERSLLLAT